MQYFAYGSNLCLPRLVERGADPSNPRIARLKGYELLFNKRSNGSSKANISAAAPSQIVWGVVFEVSDNKLEGLRTAEGFPDHYTENEIEVFIEDQGKTILATAYIAQNEKIVEGLAPFDWYLEHILRGGEHYGFPGEYLNRISKTRTIEDPLPDRSKRERGYWGIGNNLI